MAKTNHNKSKKQISPFIIGVAGGSGAGKTTIVKNLVKALDKKEVLCISHDDYYKPLDHLPLKKRALNNYDHPSSLETKLLVKHLKQLRKGQTVEKPTYDFVNHTRAEKIEKIRPKKVIIIEGILILEDEDLRSLMDLKVYVQTDADIRIIRRIQRDMKERGRTFEFVIDQYQKFTRPMHLRFIEPSKRYADIIIPRGGKNIAALDLLIAQVQKKLK